MGMTKEEKRKSNVIVIDKNSKIGVLLVVATEKGRVFNTIQVMFHDGQQGFAEKFFAYLSDNGWEEIDRGHKTIFEKKRGETIEIETNVVYFERIPYLRKVSESAIKK